MLFSAHFYWLRVCSGATDLEICRQGDVGMQQHLPHELPVPVFALETLHSS